MKALKITGLIILAIVVLALAFARFFLPGIVKNQAISEIESMTKRKASVGEIVINPLTLSVKVKEFELKEKDGTTTFVSFSSATASAALRSVVKGMPVVTRAQVVSPYLHVVRTAPQTFNFSDIKLEGETKYIAANISASRGTIEFIDHEAPGGMATHAISGIELSIPYISRSPKTDKPATFALSSFINGSPIQVSGSGHPYGEPPDASLHLSLKNLNMPFYHRYLPPSVPVTVSSGTVSTNLQIDYTGRKEKESEINLAGKISLDNLLLQDRQKQPLLSVGQLATDIHSADLTAAVLNVNLLELNSFDLHASRNSRGVWNFQKLIDSLASIGQGKTAAKKQQKKQPSIRVARTQVKGGKIHLADDAVSPNFKTVIRDISLEMGGFSTAVGSNAQLKASLNTSKGEKIRVAGTVTPEPLAFEGNLAASGIGLGDYHAYLSQYVTTPVTGTVATSGDVFFNNGGKDLRVSNLDLSVHDLRVPFGGGDYAKVGAIVVKDGKVDLTKNTAKVAGISVKNGDVKVTRSKEGKFSFEDLIKKIPPEKGKSVQKKRDELQYLVKNLTLADLNVTFRDRSVSKAEPAIMNFSNLSAKIDGITGPDHGKMPYHLSTDYGSNGHIMVTGTVNLEPFTLKTHAVVNNIPLADFAPYAIDTAAVSIADGRLGADITADIAKKGAKLTGSYGGNARVQSLRLQDARDKSNLLLWEMLRLDQLRGTLQPLAINADRVLLSEYFANVVIGEDGTINLLQKLKEARENLKGTAQAQPKQPEVKPEIRIDLVTLENGVLEFKDYSLDPHRYATRFVQLGGRISGLSSEPGTRADVDLRGSLENHSPLRISGKANPLTDPLYADLKIDFDNIELARLTPYSSTYLGYRVEQGKLRATLNYKISDEKIQATNRILINQLFFGRAVESEKAMTFPLPVPSAVGLLKDRQGQIQLDVPVEGSIANPDVNMTTVVWEAVKDAFKGLFRRIFVNPFSFLFGGRAEEFRTIYFDYGSPALSKEEKQRLMGLAQKMGDRPELKLDVTGYVDRERDPEGFRRYLLTEKMRMAKYLDLMEGKKKAPQAGHIPENVQITEDDDHKYLKQVYEQAEFPRPKTVFGNLKDLPDDEMRKLLLAHTVVGDQQLRELSRQRSQAVRDFLSSKGNINPDRLYLRIGDLDKPPAQSVQSDARVEFSLATVKGN